MEKIKEDISTETSGNKWSINTLRKDIEYVVTNCAIMPNGVSVNTGTPGSIPNTFESVVGRAVKDRGLPPNSTLEDVEKFDLENPD